MKVSRAPQRGRIFQLLIAAGGEWVPLPKILELKISQFGARILELRRSGLNIENRTERIDGQRHSWYRIEQCKTVALVAEPIIIGGPSTFPEFGSLAPESYGVD